MGLDYKLAMLELQTEYFSVGTYSNPESFIGDIGKIQGLVREILELAPEKTIFEDLGYLRSMANYAKGIQGNLNLANQKGVAKELPFSKN